MRILQRAEKIARQAHAGQTDKAGRPYIEHVERVAQSVSGNPDACAVAWLHDVLEDCAPSYRARVFDMPVWVHCAVERLTRVRGERPEHYYAGIKKSSLALKVKLADIADNSDEERLKHLDEATQARLRRKYLKAREALGVA